MRKIFLSIILLSAILTVFTAPVTEDEMVLVLTDANFDEVIKQHEFLLVEFYAPWCGHCKKLVPEYAGAAKQLRPDNLYLAKVDATEQKELGKRFDVSGYPTLKFFIKGVPMDYEGGRTTSEIVSWIRKKTGPASKDFKSVSEVESFQSSNEAVVVFFGETSSTAFSAFEITAKGYDDVAFGHCGSEECRTHFKATQDSVVIFKKFDEGRNDLPTGFTPETLKQFIDTNGTATVMKFDEKSAQHIFGKAVPAIFLYRDKNSENTEKFDAAFTAVAKKVKGRIQCVITDIKEGLETRLAEYIGVTAADLPSVRIADTRSDLLKYNMQGEITEENIMKFIDDWENGSLGAHFKSEEIPKTQEGDVIVVVGKSFNDIVMDDSKDVLVEFYAPWCGHCKKIAPIYDEVAKNLKHNTNLVIAKVDSTANEVSQVAIKGFPTIKFFPAGKKSSPIDFDGDRTVEGFTTWLEKHVTNKITTGTTTASTSSEEKPEL
jgi:protein disulfide-isomerase A1